MSVLRGLLGTVLLLLAPIGILLYLAWKFWRIRRKASRGIDRQSKQVRNKGKQVRKKARKVKKGAQKRL